MGKSKIKANSAQLELELGLSLAKIKIKFVQLARNQNANIATSIRVESIYALSVLLSGVAPLNLLDQEIAILHAHLQKLPRNTPDVFVMFFA